MLWLSANILRCINHHAQHSCKMPSLTAGNLSKYNQLAINVQFLLLRQSTGWSSQQNCFIEFVVTEHHITIKCQTMIMHQPPQNSCKYVFPDWCANELGSNKTYLSVFNSFYYAWTLAKAAKNAALLHCCWVPKMKVLQPLQNSRKKAFPDKCRNECDSNKTNLSMFNRFYYDWMLDEAAKNAVLLHCCWVPKMKVLQPPQHSCI